ncbi:MAG: ribonuclease P protein component [Patescibacteria group bacterium]|jgi:ribonuclease P protein component
MLPQEHRLRNKKDIDLVFSSGKSIFDPICGVKFRKNGLDASRFAIVAGIKVHKSAVKRNYLRRQYREIIQKHLENIVAGCDFILLPSKKALDIPFAEKETGLIAIFKKGKVWQENKSS